jgi:carbon monoxide dehydrogenase subunit G
MSKYLFLSNETGMATFHISKEISAPLDDVWNLVSDVDREPEFWHGTKSVKNIRKEGNVVERETVIAGPIKGTKDIILTPIGTNETRVEVKWDITVKGFFGLFRGIIKKHISEGTRDALNRISNTAT